MKALILCLGLVACKEERSLVIHTQCSRRVIAPTDPAYAPYMQAKPETARYITSYKEEEVRAYDGKILFHAIK